MKQAKIGLPEVIKLEVQRHMKEDLLNVAKDVRDGHERLLAVFGRLAAISLPSADQINSVVQSAFDGMGVPIVPMPLTLESAKEAFIRVIEKRPPSQTNQQFKDCVIWFDCKKFADSDEVILVSNDKNFFYNSDLSSNELNSELANESSLLAHQIRVISSLSRLLEEIKEDVRIEESLLLAGVDAAFGEELRLILDRNGLFREELVFQVKTFATENPSEVYTEVSGRAVCRDIGSKQAVGDLLVGYVGKYHIGHEKIVGVRPRLLRIEFVEPRAGRSNLENHYLYAEGLVLGVREAAWELRAPL